MTTAVQNDVARLVTTREEAVGLIRAQLEKGLAIKAQRIRSAQGLERAREQKLEWNQVVTTLLQRLFTSDAVAEDYNNFVGKILPEYADLGKFIEHFYDEMDTRLKRLHAILKQVEAEPEIVFRRANSTASAPVARAEPQRAPAPPPEPEPEPEPQRDAEEEPAPERTPAPAVKHHTPHRNGGRAAAALVMHIRHDGVEKAVAHFVTKLGFELVRLIHGESSPKAISEAVQRPDVAFAIILAGEDDIAVTQTADEISTAASRQASFELGYYSGKLRPDRVCVLHTGIDSAFHDEYGILYIPADSAEGWQLQLARQLKRGGIEVDLNRLC